MLSQYQTVHFIEYYSKMHLLCTIAKWGYNLHRTKKIGLQCVIQIYIKSCKGLFQG